MSDRIEVEKADATGYRRVTRYCGCCDKRADNFSFVRRIQDGEIIPRGYGIAWVQWHAPCSIAMPIPFNLIAGCIHRLRWWMKAPRNLFSSPADAYRQGYRAGLEQARKEQP